ISKTSLQSFSEELEGGRVRLLSLFRDFKLKSEPQEFEVSLGDLTDQREHNSAPGFLRREVLGSGSLVLPPDLAPDIHLPRCAGHAQKESLSASKVGSGTADK